MANDEYSRRKSLWDANVMSRDMTIDIISRLTPATVAESIPVVLIEDAVDRIPWDHPIRHLDFMSLYIARTGTATHVIDGLPYNVVRGDVYVMRPGMAHLFTRNDGLVLDTVHFKPEVFDASSLEGLYSTPGYSSLFNEEIPVPSVSHRLEDHQTGPAAIKSKWLHLTPTAYEIVSTMYTELLQEWRSGTNSGKTLTIGLLFRLLVFLSREYTRAHGDASGDTAATGYTDIVAMAVQYIDTHFAERIRVAELASTSFLSHDRFTSIFRAQMGCTPSNYLGYVRLEHSKTLLAQSDLSIASIAGQCGYSDPAHFTSQFRERTGEVPREYRRRLRGK